MLSKERRAFRYPPYYHLLYVYLKHRSDEMVESASIYLGGILRQWFGDRVLGPDKPAVARIKTLSIRKMIIKLENGIDQQRVRTYLKKAQQQLQQDKKYGAVQIYYDVDPL
jgi:primosomal protein N' (replication factor Y)